MIRSLEIKNFQSHKDSYFEFDKGVNIIVGESDSGKTAILRALRWLIWNRPSGDSIRSVWGGETRVTIFVDDIPICRIKDKQEEYILEDSHFTAFRTDVPEEIQKVLNFNEINLQNQLDAPFLLSETPGAVALYFNKIARLDKIDTGLQNINSWIRELNNNIKYQEGQETKYKEEIKKYDYLEKFETEVEVLEEMDEQYKTSLQQSTKLENLILDINDSIADIKEVSEILQYEKAVNDILFFIEQRAEIDLQESRLEKLLMEINNVQNEIKEQSIILEIEKPVNDIVKLIEEADMLNKQQKSLFKLLSSIDSITNTLNVKNALKTSLEEKLSKLEICPFCGSKLK